ncbi:MAG: acetolactate synthase [Verrucomicrobiae bacterium]|nr:acetolactate synthase [Verrucomicrobiae bacterium]
MPKASTSKKAQDPVIQFSVFVENKVGRLLDLVKLFSQHNVHVVALSIVDTTDSAINRIVVDDPDTARMIFSEHAYAFSECALLAVEMERPEVDFKNVLTALVQAECNVLFVYSFLIQPRGKSCLAIHVDDNDIAVSVLHQAGFNILNQTDISR